MSAVLLASDATALTVGLTVNGRTLRLRAEPRTHLADLLRDGLDLTGTHLGCEHGVCGACTILLDGEPARSCLTYAGMCEGAAVTTIEGLDADEIATELRAAFTREHALQCGYCTPGMLVAARDLVLRLPEADERRVRLGLAGNLCRCTGYVGIVRAILAVLDERRGRGIGPVVATRALGPVGSHTANPLPGGERRAGAQRRPGEGDGRSPESAGPLTRSLRDSTSPHRREGSRASPHDDGTNLEDFTPASTFVQSFTLPFPPDAVFALFGRVEEVAACLPGAVVSAMPAPDRVEGEIRVRLGPIAAAFRGRARISRDEATFSGRIAGAGEDTDGRSSTQAAIDYRVRPGPGPDSAQVDLTVGYTLKGPLAQFGRPGLVRDLAGRITAEFARNVEARLGGRAAPAPASLDTIGLLAGLVRGWISTLVARVRRRG